MIINEYINIKECKVSRKITPKKEKLSICLTQTHIIKGKIKVNKNSFNQFVSSSIKSLLG